MRPTHLLFAFCVQGAVALRVVPRPNATRFKDIKDTEITARDMQRTQMKDWNLTIMTYPQNDVISRTFQKDGTWEADAVNKACEYYQTHGGKGNMLDIGANIGAFSLPLASCIKKHRSNGRDFLIAIEAMKKNSQRLRAGIKLNKLDSIHLFEYAVTGPDANNNVVFHEEEGNKGHSHVVLGRKATSKIEYDVPATTLDAITKVEGSAMKRIFFMKMDIEGHEPYALEGAKEFMKSGPCIIFVELNNIHTKPLIEEFGYVPTTEGNGTGGQEGWFQHENMTSCLAKL